MATIKPIQTTSVHQIQSGQVITDLCSVAKELVENSLDAGATSVDVRFKNYGLDSIEVQDNGRGISSPDFDSIARKHYTSKLSSYDDLTSLETFGFRGEALSSLCALARLCVTTARADSGAKGSRLDFETSGELKSTTVVAAPRGTTVSVEDLFHTLPVRRKELERHAKREYAKVLNMLQAYACIAIGVRFNLSHQAPKAKRNIIFSTNANPSARENIANIFGAKAMLTLLDLDLVLDMQSTQNLLSQKDQSDHEVRIKGHVSRPAFGEGRQAPDRQMLFVNSRPCNLPQISKVFNQVYKSYNAHQSPFVFANLILDTNDYDVNVSPDKRTILLHEQTALLEALRQGLVDMFDAQASRVPISQAPDARLPDYTPVRPYGQISPQTGDDTREARRSPLFTSISSPGLTSPVLSHSSPREDVHASPEAWTTQLAGLTQPDTNMSRAAPTPNAFDHLKWNPSASHTPSISTTTKSADPAPVANRKNATSKPNAVQSTFSGSLRNFVSDSVERTGELNHATTSNSDMESDDEDHRPQDAVVPQIYEDHHSTTGSSRSDQDVEVEAASRTSSPVGDILIQNSIDDPDSDPDYIDEITKREIEDRRVAELIQEAERQYARPSDENVRRAERVLRGRLTRADATYNIVQKAELTFEELKSAHAVLYTKRDTSHSITSSDKQLAVSKLDNANAENKLALSIAKKDFLSMRVVGQFNLGFILAVRPATESHGAYDAGQLFIIDQHAADEIYNYEQLSQTTHLTPQNLVQPKSLELSAVEEEIILSNSRALEMNGFRVSIDDSHATSSGRRCSLLALPTSKGTTFNLSDFEELVHLLGESIGGHDHERHDHGPAENVVSNSRAIRPSRVRKMLAMRACRSSIMIGKTLTHKRMLEVVRHMGNMDKPWNCPHGRPTMRHLAALDTWQSWSEDDQYWRDDTSGKTDWDAYMAKKKT